MTRHIDRPEDAASVDETTNRLDLIEQRLAALEGSASTGPVDATVLDLDRDRFWALHELQERHPEGAVVFAGAVETPVGERYVWQQGASTADALAGEWSQSAPLLAALGHPVRLQILQYVLLGLRTTAELADVAEVNTTGQLHHHLKDLLAARWLRSPERGRYEIPADRIVPLLVVIRASTPT